ncbi:HAMP domain-containing histidine kinase [Microbacterium esteraromaticum]|uniref:histidine kinase n=1 Tax=Microbacterium esteraromaticum TaxID=57043 RepID=A0A7D7WI54_9MICO|nr:HAMP domain-containing sensor histidine kinase [Microbacterium esteraromaticum]QMU96950.1 HAMP domain-containing histidine kinase [Microbacterium esteraromaticum]
MPRARGLSVRWRLTLSYAAIVIVSGVVLLTVVSAWLLRYVPDGAIVADRFVPNRSDLVRAFTPAVVVALVVLLLIGVGGGWLLAGRMLAPLDRIGHAARLAAEGSLSHRIAMEGRGDEFRDLADVFDSMLERLETNMAEQKRFAANASHELRTPLAISQALLEVARTDPGRDADALIGRLSEVNTRAIELTEALLLLSRADRRAFTNEPVDLSLLAEEAVETLAPLADRRGVSLEVGGEEAPALGSPALLQQLIMNLVHNAVVHNLASGGMVAVRTHVRPRSVALVVENTGEVLAPGLVETLVEPFQRGAERERDPDLAGVGLGLAIAQRITEAHDGSLMLAPRDGGGLNVTVWLPRPPA